MNRRHRAAQLAGRASVQLHTLIFFASEKHREEDAYVLDVDTAEKSDPFISVIVPRYGIEGRVKLPVAADDPQLIRQPKEHKIVYSSGHNEDEVVSIQVFDRIRVRISVRQVQEYQRELVIELVQPTIAPEKSKKRSKDEAHSSGKPSKKVRRK